MIQQIPLDRHRMLASIQLVEAMVHNSKVEDTMWANPIQNLQAAVMKGEEGPAGTAGTIDAQELQSQGEGVPQLLGCAGEESTQMTVTLGAVIQKAPAPILCL